MGGVRKARICEHCPWSVALADPLVSPMLTAYGIIERFKEWPPGRRDPRLMSALTVIASEHNRVTLEQLKPKK